MMILYRVPQFEDGKISAYSIGGDVCPRDLIRSRAVVLRPRSKISLDYSSSLNCARFCSDGDMMISNDKTARSIEAETRAKLSVHPNLGGKAKTRAETETRGTDTGDPPEVYANAGLYLRDGNKHRAKLALFHFGRWGLGAKRRRDTDASHEQWNILAKPHAVEACTSISIAYTLRFEQLRLPIGDPFREVVSM